jgi:hypothetical protein
MDSTVALDYKEMTELSLISQQNKETDPGIHFSGNRVYRALSGAFNETRFALTVKMPLYSPS